MSTLKFEIPTDEHIVLQHIGVALQNIAAELRGEVKPTKTTTTTNVAGDVSKTVAVTEPVSPNGEKLDATAHVAAAADLPRVSNETTDADGLPWDARIHSKNKSRLADDTWRAKKKPADYTDEAWSKFVEEVKTELRELMAIPVADLGGPYFWEHPESDSFGVVQTEAELLALMEGDPHCAEITEQQYDKLTAEANPFAVTPPVTEQAVVTPPVTEQAVVTPPVTEQAVVTPPVTEQAVVTPPVTEQVVVTPPVTEQVVVTPPATAMNFGQLMQFITSNNKKLTSEQVTKACADIGVAKLPLLASRPDLIPQVHAALKALL